MELIPVVGHKNKYRVHQTERQVFDDWADPSLGHLCCTAAPGLDSSVLLMLTLGGSRGWPKSLCPYLPHGRPGLSFKLLALA